MTGPGAGRIPVLLLAGSLGLALSGEPAEVRSGRLSTEDGLRLELSSAGEVLGLEVDGQRLTLETIASGFAFRELPATAADLVPNGSFEVGPPRSWSWKNNEDGEWTLDSQGASGARSMRLTIPGPSPKRGPALLSDRFPVQPQTVYTLTLRTRSRELAGNLAVYVVERDASGRSRQRGVSGVPGTTGWTSRHLSFTSGPAAAEAHLKIEVYRGHGTVWVDDVRLLEPFAGRRPAPFRGRVALAGDALDQTAEASGLRLEARLRSVGSAIEARATLTDRTGRDRAVELSFALPLDASGWNWEESFVSRAPVQRGARYENLAEGYGPRGYSVYPFATLTGPRASISLAVPPIPQLARLTYDSASGFRVAFDLGLSPAAKKTPSRATVRFWIYRQEPRWGYRAAAQKYYALNPESFTSEFAPEGAWVLTGTRELLERVPVWRDFGWGWIEGVGNVRFGKANGLPSLHYLDPWGWFKAIPGHSQPSPAPSYEAIDEALRGWAAGASGTTTDSAPVSEMARAVVSSSPWDPDGRFQVKANPYFWYGGRLQIFPVSADPEIPPPSMWSVTKRYSVDNRIEWARSKGHLLGGFFLDDLSATFSAVENHRKELWAYSDSPLAFSLASQRVALYNGFSMAEAVEALRRLAHGRRMALAGNVSPSCYSWFAPLLDIVGGEVPGAESFERAYLRRALSYGKRLSNLLVRPGGRRGAPSAEELLAYLRQALLLGYFPGFAESYWKDPASFERDRPLFKKYMPLIFETTRAGWQPVTHVRVSDPAVFVERFGQTPGPLFVSALNSGNATAARFEVENDALGLAGADLRIVEMLSGSSLSFTREGERILFTGTLEKGEAVLYRIGRRKTEDGRRRPDQVF